MLANNKSDVYVPKVPKVQSLSQCEIAVSNDPKENLLFESPNLFVVLSEGTSIEPPCEETEVSMADPIEETIHVPVCQRRSKSPKTASPEEVKTHNLSIIKEEPEILQEQILEEESFHSREGLSSPDVSSESSESSDEEMESSATQSMNEVNFSPGPLGNKFMDTRTILDLLKAPHSLMEEIPTGRKDGMFYFVNNEENIKRRGNKEHSEFWDDCGAWESGTSPATLFTEVGGKLISVKLYKSLYVTEKRVNKKKEFIQLC